MANVCIIPARGGSKRIPRKNIKDFLGKPIIAYSIEVALQSGLFDEVMVSTDDDEIAKIAEKYGATVPFKRSIENSSDFATTVDVLIETIHEYQSRGVYFTNACCIYPTAPLSSVDTLTSGFEKLMTQNFDSVFPIVSFGYPVWRGLKESTEGKIQMVWPEYMNSRSQDLEKVYHDAGQWYWVAVKPLLANRKLFAENTSCVHLDELQVQDIDTTTDWKLAELKYELLQIVKK